MSSHGPFDMIIADEPYGDTAMKWDRRVSGWAQVAADRLSPTGSMWVFGSMKSLMRLGVPAGLRYAQDIVWEKHNGTGFAADRFKRVHEHSVQFIRADAPWSKVFNEVQRIAYYGPNKHVRQRNAARGKHLGKTGDIAYEDDGFRIVRSVLKFPSVRGGKHGTEKPVSLLELLIRTSCPPGGLVGDFFAGSGAAGEAAFRCGRNYIGCEIDPAMAEVARARLAELLPAAPVLSLGERAA